MLRLVVLRNDHLVQTDARVERNVARLAGRKQQGAGRGAIGAADGGAAALYDRDGGLWRFPGRRVLRRRLDERARDADVEPFGAQQTPHLHCGVNHAAAGADEHLRLSSADLFQRLAKQRGRFLHNRPFQGDPFRAFRRTLGTRAAHDHDAHRRAEIRRLRSRLGAGNDQRPSER
jgi:hypothetical protein